MVVLYSCPWLYIPACYVEIVSLMFEELLTQMTRILVVDLAGNEDVFEGLVVVQVDTNDWEERGGVN